MALLLMTYSCPAQNFRYELQYLHAGVGTSPKQKHFEKVEKGGWEGIFCISQSCRNSLAIILAIALTIALTIVIEVLIKNLEKPEI
jgi:hypothetical protein